MMPGSAPVLKRDSVYALISSAEYYQYKENPNIVHVKYHLIWKFKQRECIFYFIPLPYPQVTWQVFLFLTFLAIVCNHTVCIVFVFLVVSNTDWGKHTIVSSDAMISPLIFNHFWSSQTRSWYFRIFCY